MSSTPNAIKERYDAIIRPCLDAGMFTHSFAACGNLNEASPRFSQLDGPIVGAPDSRYIKDRFDLASLTKALCTTPLAFRHLKGFLERDLSVGDFVANSELGSQLDPRLKCLKISALLRHESGLPAWRNFYVRPYPEMVKSDSISIKSHQIAVLNRAANDLNPSQGQRYSDVGFILLGLTIQEHTGMTLDKLYYDLCTKDLGLNGDIASQEGFPRFFAQFNDKSRFVPTSFCALRERDLCGEVHDENAWSFDGIAAHAGLAGSGNDVIGLLRGLWDSEMGIEMIRAQIDGIVDPKLDGEKKPNVAVNESLMGWRQGADYSSEVFGDGLGFGHMGFTGTAFWVLESGDYGVFLTNRICSGRKSINFKNFRRKIFLQFCITLIP